MPKAESRHWQAFWLSMHGLAALEEAAYYFTHMTSREKKYTAPALPRGKNVLLLRSDNRALKHMLWRRKKRTFPCQKRSWNQKPKALFLQLKVRVIALDKSVIGLPFCKHCGAVWLLKLNHNFHHLDVRWAKEVNHHSFVPALNLLWNKNRLCSTDLS